jgi:hypothetical protein
MTDQFGETGDTSQSNKGTTFGTEVHPDQGGTNGQVVTDSQDDIAALRRRDEHAQAHIARLESENAELRSTVVDLQAKVANAKTVESVINQIKSEGTASNSVDPNQLVDAVEARLTQRETTKTQDGNWEVVVTKLTGTFGDWNKANSEIQLKAKELGLSNEDATLLARRSPDAFFELFLPKSSEGSAGITRTAGLGQSAASTHTGEVRNQAYYTKMRRENSNKYWSVEVQAQYRRDKAAGLV